MPKLLAAANDAPLLITSLCEGVTLYKWLRQTKIVTKELTVQILAKITKHLCEIHARGVIHNDLHADNIMIEQSDSALCVSIIDLGSASAPGKCVYSSTDKDRKDIHKYPWLAPEVLLGGPTSALCDVYSLGYLMADMAGRLPNSRVDGKELFALSRSMMNKKQP